MAWNAAAREARPGWGIAATNSNGNAVASMGTAATAAAEEEESEEAEEEDVLATICHGLHLKFWTRINAEEAAQDQLDQEEEEAEAAAEAAAQAAQAAATADIERLQQQQRHKQQGQQQHSRSNSSATHAAAVPPPPHTPPRVADSATVSRLKRLHTPLLGNSNSFSQPADSHRAPAARN